MLRKGIVAAIGVAAVLVLGVRGSWAPLITPAGADPPGTRQTLVEDETFSYTAVVPPGGVILLDRPPAGSTFLVTDVLVQNQPIGGDLTNSESIDIANRSIVAIGAATRRGPTLDRRTFSTSFQVRVSGRDVESIHLTSGFRPLVQPVFFASEFQPRSTPPFGDTLAVFNSDRASAVAFVQIFGRLVPTGP
jgi:hypothetical protein